ncbi:MAG: MetQ/NlpA family ABC transporter substrate-binding protein [Lachnospiraceae bacterium]
MKKRVLAVTLATVLAAGVLSACASKTETTGADATPETAATEEAVADEEAATEEAVVESKGTITVAATSVPHAEILEQAKPLLAAKGWDLEVTEFSDYVLPNEVVESGEIDANYFQHQPYLDSFNEEKGTHIVSVAKIHYEPFGIYAGKESDFANISEGAEIAIPNDTTNEARALLLLQDNGLITLNDGVGITATVNDIKDNPKNLKFVELAAEQIARTLPDVAFGIINGNYALEAGLTASEDAIVTETSDSEAAKTYANIVAVKEGNENNEGIQALIEVLKSDEIKQFINDNYQGSVVPFED